MLRWLSSTLWIVLAAVAGALLGRLAAELRRRAEHGDELAGVLDHVSLDPRTLTPREVVPGLVAAVRVGDVPWSYLHIPRWLAALCVNGGAAALARELAQIEELMELRPSESRERAGGAPDEPPDHTPDGMPGGAPGAEPSGDLP